MSLIRAHSENYSIEEKKTVGRTKEDRPKILNIFEEAEKAENDEESDLLFRPRPMAHLPTKLNDLNSDICKGDFQYIKYLGRGAFGTVDLYRWKINNQPYAIKQLNKQEVAKQNRVKHLLREKDLMNKCHHPNVVRLESTFKDDDSCYFCLEYHPVGDLASLIQKKKKLGRSLTRFYAIEMINALSYFRKHNIVHRDMKPENILIDGNFHCKISDFGAAKVIDPVKVNSDLDNVSFQFDEDPSGEIDHSPSFEMESESMEDRSQNRGCTFVGTPLYVSPEMLAHNIACFGSDLWGLGCIIYQCLTGRPPFVGSTQNQVFDQILEWKVEFPPDFDIQAEDLILRLMELNPRDRLGAGQKGWSNSIVDLRAHPFFKNKKHKKIHLKAPPVSTSFVKKINKDFQINQSDDVEENVEEFEDDLSPMKHMPSRSTSTIAAVKDRSQLISVLKRNHSNQSKPYSYTFM